MTAQSATTDLAPLNRIRVETAFSRFPVHCLAKKGTVAIDLQHSNDGSQAPTLWKVSYNSEYGQPGPLAYKIDTLIVNRRIDEAPRPLPEIIKLGSLREICRDLGITDHNTDAVKWSLHQNASAYITGKIRYKNRTGKEKRTEIGYSRYSLVFTGEVLPDGNIADAVYLILNTYYRELLNQVEVRPLDYDYLKGLPPGPQRFYELLSFQIYGALASGRSRAKMLYSDYCKYAPQTRYPDFEHVKKQMFKIHIPHRESAYITKIEYQETTDTNGTPDWEMLYTPGPKAIAEFEAFANRQARLQSQSSMAPGTVEPAQTVSANDSTLLTEMTRRGVAERKARELLANIKPQQEVMDQIEYVDSLVAKDTKGRLENPPGLYVFYIRDNIAPPADFLSTRKRRLQLEAQQEKHAHAHSLAQLKLDYEAYCIAESKRFIREVMSAQEHQRIFDQHYRYNRSLFKNMTDEQLRELTDSTVRAEIQKGRQIQLLSLEEFSRKQSERAA
jgi:hypothetical protein